MLKSIIWPAFILLVLAQWWMPLQIIWKKERVLANGSVYRFQTAPVDPNDPFRGKYVVLTFRENSIRIRSDSNLSRNSKVYLTFTTDKKGFAKIQTLSLAKPAGNNFLETNISYATIAGDSSTVFIDYPFRSFYLEEYKAPQAERIYNESNVDSAQNAYALVSILNGDAVVKNVFINDSSILQVIQARNRIR